MASNNKSAVSKERAKKIEVSPELNAYQLSAIKQQLEQEIELLSQSIEQLFTLMNRFKDSKKCVQKQAQIEIDSEILVPLTASMYVNAQLKDNQNFLIDIGTGYYVEKDLPAALEFFDRKVAFLTVEIEKLTKQTQDKINIRDSVLEALQFRQQHQQQIAGSS